MSYVKKLSVAAAVCVSVLCAAPALYAQSATIRFRNAMQSTADVRIVAVGSTTASQFAIGTDNVVEFSFSDAVFDIQVIPRDNPNTGFRFSNVNLRELATTAQGGILTLDGAFGPGQQTLVCRRRLFHCKCHWCVTRGERIAVGLIAPLTGGGEFRLESPTMPYGA